MMVSMVTVASAGYIIESLHYFLERQTYGLGRKRGIDEKDREIDAARTMTW